MLEKIINEPKAIILQDGSKLELKDQNFILFWDISEEKINSSVNVNKELLSLASDLCYRTSIALKLNSLRIKWPKALNIAVTEEKETIDLLFTLLEEKEGPKKYL